MKTPGVRCGATVDVSASEATLGEVRHDQLQRVIGASRTRRGLLRRITSLPLAGSLGAWLGHHNAEAKKKRRKKCKGGGRPVKGNCCKGSMRVCSRGCGFRTVQGAINASRRGATITICPGTYREHLTIAFGKNVTLTGSGDGEGAGDTILENPGNIGAVVVVGTGTTATLQHLRIAGGSGSSVIGLSNSGTARLTDCTISGHKSTSLYTFGGGIDNRGTLSLTDCTVSENAAGTGGGIFNYGGEVTLTGCTISGNTAELYGGGVWNDGPLDVTGCEISGNSAEADGGGIYNDEGSVELRGSTIEGNTSQVDGGGIGTFGGTVTLDAASRVTGNTADVGGGIYNGGSTVTLANTENVTGNTPNNCAGDAVPQCSG
jgi:hypothetical protein